MTTNRNRRILPAALIAVFLGTLASEANAKGGLFHKRQRTVSMPTPTTCRGGSCQPRVQPQAVAAPAPSYSAPADRPAPQQRGTCPGGQCSRR